MWPHVSNHIFLYKFMRTRVGSPLTDIANAPQVNFTRQFSTRRCKHSNHQCPQAALNSTVKATETVCQAFYHILRSINPRAFFCALGLLFCALVREEAIFAVCKRCANEGFTCMCKEKSILLLYISVSMFSLEFGKIYQIFLISSVSELFGKSSRTNFFLLQYCLNISMLCGY